MLGYAIAESPIGGGPEAEEGGEPVVEVGESIAVCIATIMSTRPINLQAPMSSAAINLTVSF